MPKNPERKQLQRAEVILKVLGKQMTAVQAARELEVSRKTYYGWERRALEAMLEAVADRAGGRPSNPVNAQLETLQAERERLLLENRLLELRLNIHQLMAEGQAPAAPLHKSKGLKTSKKKT